MVNNLKVSVMKLSKFLSLLILMATAMCLAVGSKRPDAKFFEVQYPGEDRGVWLNSLSDEDAIKYGQESEKAALWAFQNYKELTSNDCRPAIRAGENEQIDILFGVATSSLVGSVACMLAGHKNVYLGNPDDVKALPLDIKKSFKEHSIKKVAFKNHDGNKGILLFTPKGQGYANLLASYYKTTPQAAFNDYLIGRLLGYPEQDTKAYYARINNQRKQGHQQEINFEQDKKEALEWLEKNTK